MQHRSKSNMKTILLPFFISLSVVMLLGFVVIFVGLYQQGKLPGLEQHDENQQTASDETGDVRQTTSMNSLAEEISEEDPYHKKNQSGTTQGTENDHPKGVTPVGRYGAELANPAYMEENHIFALETASGSEITFTFAGDILFDPGYSVMNALRQNDYRLSACISENVLQVMRDADVMMVNNEFPYSDRGQPLEDKAFTFRAPTESVRFLKEMGVDIVSLANNHAYDYGKDAFLDTLQTLEAENVLYVGAGRNKEEAQRTVYYIANDMKIAIVSATQIEKGDAPNTIGATDDNPGVFRCWNNQELLEQVRMAKANSDFVIVYIHWGTESQTETDWAQDQQAPEIVEAGADIVIGDHPHCLQKIDLVNGVPVIYSLGNFWFNSKTLDTCLFSLTLDDSGIKRMQFIPCIQSGCRTSMQEGAEKQRVIDFMNSISDKVTIDEDGFLSY